LISKTKYYLIFTPIFVIISAFILLLFTKTEIAVAINKINDHSADYFFRIITHGGTWIIFIPLVIFIVIKKDKKSILITLFSAILLLLIVGLIKQLIYTERPSLFFENNPINDYSFYTIKNFKLLRLHSFPSGHTATAFSAFLLYSYFFSKNNFILQLLFFILALLVAYSRMYLFQHFLIDTFAGSIIGVTCVLFAYFLTTKLLFKNEKN